MPRRCVLYAPKLSRIGTFSTDKLLWSVNILPLL